MFLGISVRSFLFSSGIITISIPPLCAASNFSLRPPIGRTSREVLPIGGLKEKLLAAHRGGIEIVIIPEENKKDLTEIPKNIKEKLDIVPVQWIDQVLEIALERMPEIKIQGSKTRESSKSNPSSEKNLPH